MDPRMGFAHQTFSEVLTPNNAKAIVLYCLKRMEHK